MPIKSLQASQRWGIKKLQFSINIWLWHRSLLERHASSTFQQSSIGYSTCATTDSRYQQIPPVHHATHQ